MYVIVAATFFCNLNFSASPLGKEIGPRSQNQAYFTLSRKTLGATWAVLVATRRRQEPMSIMTAAAAVPMSAMVFTLTTVAKVVAVVALAAATTGGRQFSNLNFPLLAMSGDHLWLCQGRTQGVAPSIFSGFTF